MEILSLFRLNIWRLVALLAFSAICATIAAFSIAGRPVSYTADATVFVARALPSTASPFEVTPFAADFEATTQLVTIRQAVADRLGLPLDDVEVTTERREGSTVLVMAGNADAETAEVIASSMASASLEFLARDRITRSDSLLAERQAVADEARSALRTFEEQNGYTDVVREYDTRVVQMLELEGRAEDQSADLTLAERRQLSDLATDIRDELPALAENRDRFLELSRDVDESTFALDSVTSERRSAEAGLISATTSDITATEAEPTSKVPLIVQAAVAATIVVFVLGIAIFFIADLIRDRSKATTTTDESDTTDLDSVPDSAVTDSAVTDDHALEIGGDDPVEAADELSEDPDEDLTDHETVATTTIKPMRVIDKTAPSGSSSSTDRTSEGGRVIAMNAGASSSGSSSSGSSSNGSAKPKAEKSGELRPAAGLNRNRRSNGSIRPSTTSSNGATSSKGATSSNHTDTETTVADTADNGSDVMEKAVVGGNPVPPVGSATARGGRRRTKITKGRG